MKGKKKRGGGGESATLRLLPTVSDLFYFATLSSLPHSLSYLSSDLGYVEGNHNARRQIISLTDVDPLDTKNF